MSLCERMSKAASMPLGTHISSTRADQHRARRSICPVCRRAVGDHRQFQTLHGINHLGTGASGSGHALDPGGEYTWMYTVAQSPGAQKGPIQTGQPNGKSAINILGPADVTLLPPGTLFNLFPEGVKDQFELAADQFSHQAS